jgi:hypothetical protein
MMSILDRILSVEHRKRGLSLAEDDHTLYLIKNGHTIALWSAQGATWEEIHREADKQLYGDAVKELVSCGGVSFKN